jgi:hypothetical protein
MPDLLSSLFFHSVPASSSYVCVVSSSGGGNENGNDLKKGTRVIRSSFTLPLLEEDPSFV